MSILDPYLINSDSELHLRDARHAHQLYNQHNFALAPKMKFLYHVVFEFSAPLSFIPNSDQFRKELGVLANAVSLPSYRLDVDTKHQYNRKKNVQTGINYDEVTFEFIDDNTGVTRALMEEYYRFYYRDGGKHENGTPFDFDSRDKFTNSVPRYGLDNLEGKGMPFFKNIRIYQLARQKWVSYTLVNPLVTSFKHDDLSYADSDIVMNSMNLAYEAVMYDSGEINPNADPAGFTSQETRYDNVPSPLGENETYGADVAQAGAGRGIEPSLIKQSNNPLRGSGLLNNFPGFANSSSSAGDPLGTLNKIVDFSRNPTIGGVQQIVFPKANSQASSSLSSMLDRSVKNLDGDAIRRNLSGNKAALNTTVKRSLATGSFSSDWNSSNFDQFDNLSTPAKSAIETEVVDRASNGDKKIQQIASQVISSFKGIV
jgi:hypothetical protein